MSGSLDPGQLPRHDPRKVARMTDNPTRRSFMKGLTAVGAAHILAQITAAEAAFAQDVERVTRSGDAGGGFPDFEAQYLLEPPAFCGVHPGDGSPVEHPGGNGAMTAEGEAGGIFGAPSGSRPRVVDPWTVLSRLCPLEGTTGSRSGFRS
jgi:hypothetical protein